MRQIVRRKLLGELQMRVEARERVASMTRAFKGFKIHTAYKCNKAEKKVFKLTSK
jgi:hypothetical protein